MVILLIPCLPSSQIHQVYHRALSHGLALLILTFLQKCYGYNSVGTTAGGIHVGRGYGPVFGALGHPVLYLLVALNSH